MTVGNADLPSPPMPKKQKLGGYDFYRSIGSPKWVVAPMVDQSELAWRMLSRSPLASELAGPSTSVTTPEGRKYTRQSGGAHLCYTPMIHAKVFVTSPDGGRGTDGQFNLTYAEEGSGDVLAGIEGGDRPLIVQFCANDPEILLAAAKKVERHCDAVDINFGCPQGIARRGNYGAFLQDDWGLIHRLISTLHENLSIPVTAKFRIHPDPERTLAYARMMEAAGAQIVTCHGRTRDQKGQRTGLADWEMIRQVKKALKIPVFANGNILYAEDVQRCLDVTGCDGVMTAEGNLSNPAIFLPPDHPYTHPPITLLAHRYLDIVSSLSTPTAGSAVKSHLFRLLKPALDTDEQLRIKIGKCSLSGKDGLEGFRAVVREIEERWKDDMEKAKVLGWEPPAIDATTGYRSLPVWAAQPLIRLLPVSSEVGGNDELVNEEIGAAPGRFAADMNQADVRLLAVSSSRAASPPPGGSTNTSSPCSHSSCAHVAALRCPHRACLLHCRQINAVASGMSAEEAAAEASRGELVGKGCEAHEEKVRARRERMAEKRKNRAEGKRAAKARRKGRKGAGIETDGHDEHEMMEGQDGEEKSIEMDEEEKYLATAAA